MDDCELGHDTFLWDVLVFRGYRLFYPGQNGNRTWSIIGTFGRETVQIGRVANLIESNFSRNSLDTWSPSMPACLPRNLRFATLTMRTTCQSSHFLFDKHET